MRFTIGVERGFTLRGMTANGVLKTGVKSEEDGAFPFMVLEMDVIGGDIVELGLDEQDISTIVRLANESKVEKLRDAASPIYARAKYIVAA